MKQEKVKRALLLINATIAFGVRKPTGEDITLPYFLRPQHAESTERFQGSTVGVASESVGIVYGKSLLVNMRSRHGYNGTSAFFFFFFFFFFFYFLLLLVM
jgi:hypothetical protein